MPIEPPINPLKDVSEAIKFARLSPEERIIRMEELGIADLKDLDEMWRFWARPNQVEPTAENDRCGCRGKWLNWVVLAGRGWGKSRTGAEWVHEKVNDGTYGLFHLVGATSNDVRKIMIEGPSGIIATAKKSNPVRFSPTRFRLDWANGAHALVFSADEPERLRGVQAEAAWADELAAWRYEEAWQQLQLGLRLGVFPRSIVTTTPRPTPLVRRLVLDPKNHVTKGTTYENIGNLADTFINEITQIYEGTRFGRQELYAEILDDLESALWNRDLIERQRIKKADAPTKWKRIVVGVDPSLTFGESSDETGIIVAGLDHQDRAFVLEDASGKFSPEGWARKVVSVYRYWQADKIVAEKNQGGDLVERNILVEDPSVPVKLVSATRSKITRAEPISTAYERGRVWHIGMFETLEQQMCNYEAGSVRSPDRLDALVWAMTELIGGPRIAVSVGMGPNTLVSDSAWWKI